MSIEPVAQVVNDPFVSLFAMQGFQFGPLLGLRLLNKLESDRWKHSPFTVNKVVFRGNLSRRQ